MHIVLLTYGSRGDVEPFLALAEGLLLRGHAVRICAPGKYEYLNPTSDIDYVALPGNPSELMTRMVEEAEGNWWRMVRVMSEHVSNIAYQVLNLVDEASYDADVIGHSFLMTNAGHELARARNIPDFSAQTFPVFSPTSEFASPAFPETPLGGIYNRLTHWLTTKTFWLGSRVIYNRMRSRHPELEALSGWPFSTKGTHRTPILYAFSQVVVPRPRDWPADARITGYWFRSGGDREGCSEEVEKFLQVGPPPIYIGFGSASGERANRALKIAAACAKRLGLRAIIQSDREAGLGTTNSGRFLMVDEVSHANLFPRLQLVIHHGGAGTTATTLRSGTPGVIVPFTADQPFWGTQVKRLGLGLEPLPASRLTEARLCCAIEQVVSSKAIKQRVMEVGAEIRGEKGVENAIDVIEVMVASRGA